jgi:hypothetical protein
MRNMLMSRVRVAVRLASGLLAIQQAVVSIRNKPAGGTPKPSRAGRVSQCQQPFGDSGEGSRFSSAASWRQERRTRRFKE